MRVKRGKAAAGKSASGCWRFSARGRGGARHACQAGEGGRVPWGAGASLRVGRKGGHATVCSEQERAAGDSGCCRFSLWVLGARRGEGRQWFGWVLGARRGEGRQWFGVSRRAAGACGASLCVLGGTRAARAYPRVEGGGPRRARQQREAGDAGALSAGACARVAGATPRPHRARAAAHRGRRPGRRRARSTCPAGAQSRARTCPPPTCAQGSSTRQHGTSTTSL